jgi:rubrerythrin
MAGHSGQVGRPFLVGGEARTSEARVSAAWRDASLPASVTLATLDAGLRGCIAEYFTQAALMEHASIAAFARFSLELLALGAPRDLVAAAAQAMADETRHAELCFELASRYAGTSVGPGTLDVTGALATVDLASVVERALLEGCVGETAAALEATWAAESATDPVVRSALQSIAADEERHAALAFRFVAWAVERDPRLLAVLQARITLLSREQATSEAAPEHEQFMHELSAHGVPSPRDRRTARLTALHTLVPEMLAALENETAPSAGACGALAPRPGVDARPE